MPAPSKRQLKHELKLLSQRTSPLFIEHFDAWLTIGIRAGGESAVAVRVAPTNALQQRIENEVLCLANDIARRRGNGKT